MSGFWDRTLEPKRTYRWILEIATMGNTSQWVAKSVTRPKWNVTHHGHKYINHTFNYPGRVEWQPIDVKLIDPVRPIDTSASFLAILRSSGYNFPTSLERGTETITKDRAVGALNRVRIKQIGENSNDILDQWVLYNAFATNVDLGELNYEGDDLLQIGMTIVYDWAYMTHAGGVSAGWTGGILGAPIPTPQGGPGGPDVGVEG